MDWLLIIKAVLSLIFVLGLLMVTLWGIKYLEQRSSNCRFLKATDKKRRLEILETKRLDARNSLYLIRRDNTEHLLLLGTTPLIIESRILTSNTQAKDEEAKA